MKFFQVYELCLTHLGKTYPTLGCVGSYMEEKGIGGREEINKNKLLRTGDRAQCLQHKHEDPNSIPNAHGQGIVVHAFKTTAPKTEASESLEASLVKKKKKAGHSDLCLKSQCAGEGGVCVWEGGGGGGGVAGGIARGRRIFGGSLASQPGVIDEPVRDSVLKNKMDRTGIVAYNFNPNPQGGRGR